MIVFLNAIMVEEIIFTVVIFISDAPKVGCFKPDEWIDQQGTKHNRIVFIANKFYPALEKEEPGAESTEQPTTKTKKK